MPAAIAIAIKINARSCITKPQEIQTNWTLLQMTRTGQSNDVRPGVSRFLDARSRCVRLVGLLILPDRIDGEQSETHTMKRIQIARLILLLVGMFAGRLVHALPPLFSENFDGLSLGPPVDEVWPFPKAFTHTPPPGWTRVASGVPGVGDPDVGVF